MTKKIPLTQGKFALVDDEDHEFLNQWKWSYCNGYAVRKRRQSNQNVYMHRAILERMGFTDFKECDHINRGKADNRRCNLRPVAHSQNMCNCSKSKNNTSGRTGVIWRERVKKWCAQIQVNGRHIHLGYFDDIEEAAQVRDEAAKKYHGEFAVLNKE